MKSKTDTTVVPVTVDVHLGPADLDAALRSDIRHGLTRSPKELQPKWLYDERGSELFDQITRLEEYYPTEAEREILLTNAAAIIERADVATIVELGSGTGDKTRALLDAARAHGRIQTFIPFDVSEEYLRGTATSLADLYPGLEVHGVVGDFDRHLDRIPHERGSQMVALLGGTIGNYPPEPRRELLERIVATMNTGDYFLLGTDLVKEPARMVLAYDDPAGVTAAFTKNVLAVLNRELRADFDLDRFDSVATWDEAAEWMDLGLVSRIDQRVHIAALDLDVDFAAGEFMRTEVSAKFRIEEFTAELGAVGLDVEEWFTDSAEDFAVSLSVLR